MRDLNDIMNEREQKVKEFENNKILKEKINNQWKEIENNIDNAEINYNTKLILLCHGIIYDDNVLKLVNFGYNKDNINYFNGRSYYRIDKENNNDNKYNLNDGLHSEESRKDDVFGKRINKENKINIDSIDKSNNKNDKTILQMYKYEDGEFKKINSDEIDSDIIKQQSKEDKLETFADLINHVLGFKYC